MSVTVAVTVTLPNWTAASIGTLGADFNHAIGDQVRKLVIDNCRAQGTVEPATLPAVGTVNTVVT
jgi:hypothetical protein